MLTIGVRGTSRDVSSIAATRALWALLVLLALSAAAAWWLGRRQQRGFGAWFAGFASIAMIVAVTLFRDGLPNEIHLAGLADWSTDGLDDLSRDPLGSSQFVLNVALFVPAGLVWAWVVRRQSLVVLAALLAGSLLIESVQGVTGVGANDVADVVANGLGAALGVGAATLIRELVRTNGVEFSSRTRMLAGVATGMCLVVAVAGWFVGAARRQDSVEHALRQRFANTTIDDVDTWLADDPELLWSAVSDRSDGSRRFEDAIEVRYPATFFSLHRCVFVTWTDTSVTFTKASGRDCTVFIG